MTSAKKNSWSFLPKNGPRTNMQTYLVKDLCSKHLAKVTFGSTPLVDMLSAKQRMNQNLSKKRLTLACFYMDRMQLQKGMKILWSSSDADVAVLACYLKKDLAANLLIHTGPGNHARLMDVQAACGKVGPSVCNALPGLHALTGCDTVSAFNGKGKKRGFDLIMKD